MTSREQFEAWFNPKKDGMKSCSRTRWLGRRSAHDAAWAVWQASREALGIDGMAGLKTNWAGGLDNDRS